MKSPGNWEKSYQKMMNALANKIKFLYLFFFFKHIIMPFCVILCIVEEKLARVKICFGQIEI